MKHIEKKGKRDKILLTLGHFDFFEAGQFKELSSVARFSIICNKITFESLRALYYRRMI